MRVLSMLAALSLSAAVALAGQSSNPPWFPSLMAFEHYDSGRTHLFEQARFGGSYSGNNQVAVRKAPATYPTGYNIVYLSPDEIFLYGGGYGNRLLLDSRVVDLPMAYNPTCVSLSSLKPLFFNSLKSESPSSDNAGA
jgi:hypothetical protein